MNKRILVVDDEAWVVQLVRQYLEAAGFQVDTARDGRQALQKFKRKTPDLLVLDWMLPGIGGLEVAKKVREHSDVPIIMLTARVDEADRILGLESGADDYVVKPFSARELEARVRTVFRRCEEYQEHPTPLEHGRIRLDPSQHAVWVRGEPVDLTPMEFDLLSHLMEHPGQVFTRLELLKAARGSTYETFERAVDSHIKRLRKKIEQDPAHPEYVDTVHGVGYRLISPDGSS